MAGVAVSPWRRWVALLDTREDPLPLALVRVAVALVVLTHVSHVLLTGVDALVWVDARHGGLRTLDAVPFSDATPGLARAMAFGTMLASALMAAGAWTRPATALTYLGFRWLGDLNGHAGGAYDEVLIDTLFVLCFARCGDAISVDAWRARDTLETCVAVPAWPRWVLLGQLVTIYVSTGLQKVSASWLPIGERDALWYILAQPDWQRRAFAVPVDAYPLTQVATALTWVWEVGAPVLLLALWYRRTRARGGWLRAQANRLDARTLFLGVGVLLHLGIETLLEVGAFSWAMLALYPCAWSGDELRARFTRVNPTRR
jgi:hypothetical protein